MKFTTVALLVAAAISGTSAHPSQHAHRAFHAKRSALASPDLKTVYVYELNGHMISEAEVQEGLRNGTLVLAPNGKLAPADPAPTSSVEVAAVSAPAKAVENKVVAASSAPAPAPTSTVAPVQAAVAAVAAAAKPTSASPSYTSSGSDSEFPDGELDCSTFPSEYGAVPVNYLGLGGWIGIQSPGSSSGGYNDIMTVVKSQCTGANCCGEGMFCSYACAPGYQKAQWPVMQGATGQSVGGILCQNGKLHLTNPSMSKSLCMPGTTKVSVSVQNKMDKGSAICRTDYPGTESETVPLDATPGSIQNLTCPDADNYYNWQGMHTSAQYYVNPAGVSVEDGCQWGSSANPWGNYAPLNLGVGYSAGSAWLSIFGNAPTTTAKLDFNIEIVGDNGGFDNMIGRCKYQNGEFCTGENYESCSSTGCTVNVEYGSATYVLTA